MIKIEIPGLPPMANGGHGAWQKDWGRKKKWKSLVGWHLLGKVPPIPYKKVKVTFTRHSSVEPDYDGMVHGFKAVKDALVEYGIVENDKMSNMDATYNWIKCKPKEGKITVEITPVT